MIEWGNVDWIASWIRPAWDRRKGKEHCQNHEDLRNHVLRDVPKLSTVVDMDVLSLLLGPLQIFSKYILRNFRATIAAATVAGW